MILGISPKVAIVELTLDQFSRCVIQFLAQFSVTGIDPSQRGCMQPFADMLAIVRPAWPIAITPEQAVRVNLHQPVLLAGIHA